MPYTKEAYDVREKGASPDPVRDAIYKLVGQQVRGTILDCGCGEGRWLRNFQGKGRLIGVDLVDDGASKLPDVEFHLCDLSSDELPCQSGSVDWVFAIEVMEHLANPRHFIGESARVLRSAGNMVISVPSIEDLTSRLSFLFRGSFPAFAEKGYQSVGHITALTESDIRRMAIEARFASVEFCYPMPGRMPKSYFHWQQFLPFLHGKLWSSSLIAILTR